VEDRRQADAKNREGAKTVDNGPLEGDIHDRKVDEERRVVPISCKCIALISLQPKRNAMRWVLKLTVELWGI
jgi:hypothetical protein